MLALVFVALMGANSAANPVNPCSASDPCHLRMREETTVIKDDGTQYRFPPGHFYDDPTWQNLDAEVKRLQDQETRLKAENKSLRESFEGWSPGWFTVTIAILVGAGAGIGGYYWYTSTHE